jgi:hypothetical protein
MKARALFLAAMLGISNPASAQNSATLETRGHWSSFVARTPDNTFICGIDVIDPNDGRHMMIKWFQRSSRITFHVSHPRWNITTGRRINVEFQVEGHSAWAANAFTAGPSTLEWVIESDSIARFENQFRYGHRMFLRFPGTGENYWVVSLYGTNAIVNSLVECMRSVGR